MSGFVALGNNRVTTVSTLYNIIARGEIGHHFWAEDILLFASVGAGMNINTFVYKVQALCIGVLRDVI